MSETNPADRSLFAAADLLDDLATVSGESADWSRRVRVALRAGTAAVEACLDDFVGRDGLATEIAGESPRLIYATGSLEAALARLLVDLWESEVDGAAPDPGFARRLHRLAVQMRHLGNRELELLWESLIQPGALD
jgi:hypothetical protein